MRKTLIAAALARRQRRRRPSRRRSPSIPGHTIVTFEALHFGTSTQRGRLQAKEGTVVLDRAAKTGKADITLDLATVSTAPRRSQAFLQGERLFNVAQGPTRALRRRRVHLRRRQARLGRGHADADRQVAAGRRSRRRGSTATRTRSSSARSAAATSQHDPAQPVRPRRIAGRHARRDPAADPGRGIRQ